MTDANKSLADAEREMSLAIEKIREGIVDIDEFKSATETLSNMANKNEEVLRSLLEVAQLLEAGSKLLNEKGIAQFDNSIKEGFSKTDENFSKIAELQNDIVRSSDETTQRINRLQTIVIVLGATILFGIAVSHFIVMQA